MSHCLSREAFPVVWAGASSIGKQDSLQEKQVNQLRACPILVARAVPALMVQSINNWDFGKVPCFLIIYTCMTGGVKD